MRLMHTASREGKLLSFLRRELALSSSLVKRLKWKGALLLNGQPAHTDAPVRPGDVIQVLLDETIPEFPPEAGPLDILYEDDALLAVDKPAGLLMHPSFYRNTGTLANRVLGYYQETGQPCAVHPVSRLDRDTFGVVLLAKNAHIHARLMDAMAQGQLHKTYEALIFGGPAADDGSWDFPIARKGGGSLLREVRPDGQTAVTRFRVLRRFETCTQIQLEPVTGRTHQLRVHCAHTGCPILGDPQYGSEASQALSAQMGLPHQQLCAVRLEFPHPLTGEVRILQSRQRIALPHSACTSPSSSRITRGRSASARSE